MTIQIKRGKKENMPTLKEGELALATDEKKLYIGTGTENIPGLMTVDTEMSDSSRNAVQNKAAKKYVDSHIDDTAVHITTEERNMWNDKSDFSGSYDDLTEKPTIPPAYTHPVNHPATMITQDATHRFVTDTEKNTWNGQVNKTDFETFQINIGTLYDDHINEHTTHVNDEVKHVTAADRDAWNNKVDSVNGEITGNFSISGSIVFNDNSGGSITSLQSGIRIETEMYNGSIVVANGSGAARITNVETPVSDSDAATKKYVDDHSVDPATVPKFTSGTIDLTPGTSPLANGTIYFMYE